MSAAKSQPAANGLTITPSDSTRIEFCRGLYVGSGGDLAVRFRTNQETVLLVGVPTGSLLPIDVDRVMETNTTASSIVVLF